MEKEEKEFIQQQAFKDGKEFAYKRAIEACDVNETSFQVKDDIENILRRADIYE